ncbi:unnamed protein product [Brugia timori]|uniref:Uncharacterized protein n=1 Tax=Brugia timori TaxID=42155 RepID=A0A3P7WF48_9BILA|nr:unnamed protein product [Brugia timori]
MFPTFHASNLKDSVVHITCHHYQLYLENRNQTNHRTVYFETFQPVFVAFFHALDHQLLFEFLPKYSKL